MTKTKFWESILNAIRGIAHAFSKERNIQIQAIIGIIVLLFSIWLRIPLTHLIFILIICFLVIISELLNTVLERLIDHIHPEQHNTIGRIKDSLAGIVLLSIILAIVVGVLILYEPVIELLRTL